MPEVLLTEVVQTPLSDEDNDILLKPFINNKPILIAEFYKTKPCEFYEKYFRQEKNKKTGKNLKKIVLFATKRNPGPYRYCKPIGYAGVAALIIVPIAF